jgi:hypothetical protein
LVQLWEGTAWEAAPTEARSVLALAEGDPERSTELLQLAVAHVERKSANPSTSIAADASSAP